MSLFPSLLLCFNILVDPTQFAKLVELDTKTRAVSELVVESTVCIEIGVDFREGHGSGTIISNDGLILTAGHVGERSGLDCEVTLADGRKLKAVTLGQIFMTQAHRRIHRFAKPFLPGVLSQHPHQGIEIGLRLIKRAKRKNQ